MNNHASNLRQISSRKNTTRKVNKAKVYWGVKFSSKLISMVLKYRLTAKCTFSSVYDTAKASDNAKDTE